VNEKGEEIGHKLISGAQVDSHGNVQLSGSGALGDALGDHLKKILTPAGGKQPRVRADTFGYVQRCWPDPSRVDQTEARRAGRYAARCAMHCDHQGSIVLRRLGDGAQVAYSSDFARVDLAAVAGKTRLMPREFIDGRNNVSRAFIDYAMPLVGALPQFERL